MPENLYPQLPTVPSMSQENFNIEMVRKYYQDIANLKEKYTEKQQRYKNSYNRLLHATPCNIPTESIRFQWGFVRICMWSVKCGWVWSDVDGVGQMWMGLDIFLVGLIISALK